MYRPMKDSRKERLEELRFVSCPTEEKEPFFWRWTEEGKEILLAHIDRECKLAEEAEKERIKEVIENGYDEAVKNLSLTFEREPTDTEVTAMAIARTHVLSLL